jgi:hypothetical protein
VEFFREQRKEARRRARSLKPPHKLSFDPLKLGVHEQDEFDGFKVAGILDSIEFKIGAAVSKCPENMVFLRASYEDCECEDECAYTLFQILEKSAWEEIHGVRPVPEGLVKI